MKIWVVFICLLLISIPLSNAKQIEIPELFEVESQENIEIDEKEVYYYAGSKLIAVNNEYKYQNRMNSDFESKTLPFGESIIEQNRLSFTGKEFDEEFYYFGSRYYNPELGRFNSVDPVPSEPSYVYVYNNPLVFVDISGTQTGLLEVAPKDPGTAAAEAYMITEGSKLLQQALTTPKPSPPPSSVPWWGPIAAGVGTFLTVMLWATPLNEGEDELLARWEDENLYYPELEYYGEEEFNEEYDPLQEPVPAGDKIKPKQNDDDSEGPFYRVGQPCVGGVHCAFRTLPALEGFLALLPEENEQPIYELYGKVVKDDGGLDGLEVLVRTYTRMHEFD